MSSLHTTPHREPTAADRDTIERRNAALRTEIELVRGGLGDPAALRTALRESVLFLLPWEDGESVAGAVRDGIRWVYAFSSETELARHAVLRGAAEDVEVPYLTVSGERLLDGPGDVPRGLAIDVAGTNPFLLPLGTYS